MNSLARTLSIVVAVAASLSSSYAQTVTTDPVGFVNVTIAAGTGSTKTLTPLSLPLLAKSSADGQTVGKITSVTSNTFSNSNAGWTAGQLSALASPQVLKITSGTARGRTFLLSVTTANSATQVTLDSADAANTNLTTIGITEGDTYQLLACDTLLKTFGTPATTGIVAGTAAGSADTVLLSVNGALSTYYFDSGLGRWTKVTLGNPDSSNVAIRPDAGVSFSRIGNTQIALTILGSVPTTDRKVLIKNSGVTYLAQGWPIDTTLAATELQKTLNWTSSTDPNAADTVQFKIPGSTALNTYYYDGSFWRKQTLGFPKSDNQVIAAGSSLIINQRGTETGASVLSQTLPYSLN